MKNINEWSFQRFARFFGSNIQRDEEFENKITTIYKLIYLEGLDNIDEIAEKSNCTFNECVLKIKYLKNKRVLPDYLIDTVGKRVVKCDEKDAELLKKYEPFIYGKHLQIKDMVKYIPGASIYYQKEDEQKIFEDLCYLYDKNLLNGIILDKVDRVIIYYTLEKKKDYGLQTLNCPNCGSLVDVHYNAKARCEYCGTIVEGEKK